jgi:hypothetical protein
MRIREPTRNQTQIALLVALGVKVRLHARISVNIEQRSLGHVHQKVLLRSLHETRNPEPAGLLVLAFAVARSYHVAHQCSVTRDGDFFRRDTQATDDGHARDLRGAGGGEAACEGRGGRAGRRSAEGGGEHRRGCFGAGLVGCGGSGGRIGGCGLVVVVMRDEWGCLRLLMGRDAVALAQPWSPTTT